MQIGLDDLQYSGKTTLFKILSGISEQENVSLNDESKVSVVKVPDERLDKLTELFNPKKKVNAVIEVFDIPGLKTSDDGKVKITTSFLNDVRNNDALFFIIRQFENDAVPHPMGNIDILHDINFLLTEFLFSDIAFFENRVEKLNKELNKRKDDSIKKEMEIIEKCKSHVEKELPLYSLELDESERKILSGYQLLTLKPISIAINFDENSVNDVEKVIENIGKELINYKVSAISMFANIEEEIQEMDPADAALFMNDYGIRESALTKILRTSYELLGLQSFFTVGEDECRAWTIKKNMTAQESAGVIHTDFYNKFIRAEVVHYEDYLKYGSFPKCKEAGVWRLEGKEYIVKDGDILNIRHN